MEKSKTTPAVKKPSRPKTGRLLASVSLFISLIVASVFGYFGYQLYDAQKQQITLTQTQLTQLQQAQSQLNQQQQALQATKESILSLQSKQHQSTMKWTLAEVAYYLQLANINLAIERNTPVAIKLLQVADSRLASINKGVTPTSIIRLRKLINNNITTLETIPLPDVTGLLLKLQAISEQSSNLPFITPSTKAGSVTTTSQSTNNVTSKWQRTWQETKDSFKNIIIIRHHQKPVGPLLPPSQQNYLVDNIQMQFALAQWAVLHQQNKLYHSALNQANEWIERYFDNDSSVTQGIIAAIKRLQKINIKPTLPDINTTIKALKAIQGA